MKNNEVKQIILDVIYNWARAPVKVEFVSPIRFYGINDDGYDQYITAVKISLSETVHRWHWVVVSEVDIEFYNEKPTKVPQDWSYIQSFFLKKFLQFL